MVIRYQIERFLNFACRLDINCPKESIIYVSLIVGMIEVASVLVGIPLIEVGLPWLDRAL